MTKKSLVNVLNSPSSQLCTPLTFSSLSVVWEKLDQIDGDTEYVDSDFIRSSRCNPANADIPSQLLAGHE